MNKQMIMSKLLNIQALVNRLMAQAQTLGPAFDVGAVVTSSEFLAQFPKGLQNDKYFMQYFKEHVESGILSDKNVEHLVWMYKKERWHKEIEKGFHGGDGKKPADSLIKDGKFDPRSKEAKDKYMPQIEKDRATDKEKAKYSAEEGRKAIAAGKNEQDIQKMKKALAQAKPLVKKMEPAVKPKAKSVGFDPNSMKKQCLYLGIASILIGVVIGYFMYPTAKEQFNKVYDNGNWKNWNKNKFMSLLKSIGAVSVVAAPIIIGIVLIYFYFRTDPITEKANPLLYFMVKCVKNLCDMCDKFVSTVEGWLKGSSSKKNKYIDFLGI